MKVSVRICLTCHANIIKANAVTQNQSPLSQIKDSHGRKKKDLLKEGSVGRVLVL